MRILFLVSSMEGGGAERVAALLANAWVDQGHEVTLMATFSGRGGVSYPLAPEVQLEFLVDRTASRLARTPIGRLFALRRYIRELAPDAVLSFLTNVNVAAVLARGAAPVVVSERIYPPRFRSSKFWEQMRKLTYPRADTVVMQTQQGLDWVHNALPGAKGFVIGNPIVLPVPDGSPALDVDALVQPSDRLLLSVGRLDDQKNFALLIEGFARAARNRPEWRLVILGEGPERGALEARIARHGLRDRILLPGRAGNLDCWYRRADRFAFTSRVEGFPNALLEALTYGVPSLSLDCPTGPADLIEGGRNGLLLPLGTDAEALAVGLSRLLADEWPEVTACARSLADKYQLASIAAQWIALFRQLQTQRRL